MQSRERRHHERRADYDRTLAENLAAVEQALVILVHSILISQPETERAFFVMLDNVIRHRKELSDGARDRLRRIRQAISSRAGQSDTH